MKGDIQKAQRMLINKTISEEENDNAKLPRQEKNSEKYVAKSQK